MNRHSVRAISIIALSSPFSVNAAITHALTTNGSGVISGGSWTGPGSIQNNVAPGDSSVADTKLNLVNGFSTGTLVVNAAELFPSQGVSTGALGFGDQTITFSVGGGGTADLQLGNTTTFDGGAQRWNSYNITNFSGNVTSLSITVSFANLISSRNTGFGGSDFRAGPLMAALGLVSGNLTAGWNITASYDGIFSAPSAGATPVPGFGALPAAPVVQAGEFGTPTDGQTVFNQTNFGGFINQDLDNDSLLIKGYSRDGNSVIDPADGDLTYVKSQTWTITAPSSAFTAGTEFTVSLDGTQFDNAIVPEPSHALLSLVGFSLLIGRRCRN